ELFDRWGFRNRLPQLVQSAVVQNAESETPAGAPVQGELFPFGANAEGDDGKPVAAGPTEKWEGTYPPVDTPGKLKGVLQERGNQRRTAADREPPALDRLNSELVGYAFSWKEGEAYYLAVRGPSGAAVLKPDATLKKLRPVLENPAVAKVNQNIKFDLLVLR